MKLFLDSLRRAIGNCFLPQVLLLSLLPLVVVGAAELTWTSIFWEENVRGMREILTAIPGVAQLLRWVAVHVSDAFPTVVYSLMVILVATPVFIVLVLILSSEWIAPAAASLIARRRFPGLERRRGASWFKGLLLTLRHTFVALVLSLVTLPLWLIPPLGLVIPTVIWGRMTARVMAFDALADHASPAEIRAILRAHSWPLLMMGMAVGLLCALPSMLWIVVVQAVIFFPFVMVAVLWIYTMIFALSALWFTHYGLSALAALRAAEAAAFAVQPVPAAAAPGVLPLVEEVPPAERFRGAPGDDSPAAP